MKIGFNLLLWTTHVSEAHLPLLDLIGAAGYDGVEIPVFEGAPAHYAWLGGEIRRRGLSCTSVGVIPDRARNIISADVAERAAGQAHLDWLVDCSVALGAEVLCGPFHSPLAEFSGQGPSQVELARCAAAHRAMAERAAASGLVLAIEPLNRFECYVLTTAQAAADHVKAVDRPNFGYLFDTFHSNIEEQHPLRSLRETYGQISHVHVSENDRGTLGEGHVDLAGTLRALKDLGYDGWITVEAFGLALPALAAATKVWRPLFPSEEHVVRRSLAAIRRHWD